MILFQRIGLPLFVVNIFPGLRLVIDERCSKVNQKVNSYGIREPDIATEHSQGPLTEIATFRCIAHSILRLQSAFYACHTIIGWQWAKGQPFGAAKVRECEMNFPLSCQREQDAARVSVCDGENGENVKMGRGEKGK